MSSVIKRPAVGSPLPGGWRELRPASRPDGPVPAAGDPRSALERARRRLLALRERARREGYEAGYREGMAAAERRLRAALGAVRRLLLRVLEERCREDRADLEALLELAASIAHRIVGEALVENPERLAGMVRRAAEALGPGEEIEVRVHPRDLAAVAAAGGGPGLRLRLRVVEDPALEPGDAVLRGRRGLIDLRVRAQVERLLREAMAGEGMPDAG